MLNNSKELQKRRELLKLINALEVELKVLKLWQSERPSEQALASVEPFAIDSLTFVQWLQFIFIERFSKLLQLSAPLPANMSILTMANEYFKATPIDSVRIEQIIAQIYKLVNE